MKFRFLHRCLIYVLPKMHGAVIMCFLCFAPFLLRAQCPNGKVVFKEDFGGNSVSDPLYSPDSMLQVDSKNYRYISTKAPEDGWYTLIKNTLSWPPWFNYKGGDHTSPNDNDAGYMLMVNANYTKGRFYNTVLKDMCEGSEVYFSAFILSYSKATIPVNVNFEFYNADNDVLLKSFSTGDIIYTGSWLQQGSALIIPPGVKNVRFVMRNNGNGGNGNDVAIDDIEIRLCGPVIKVTASPGNVACPNDNFDLKGEFDNFKPGTGEKYFNITYYQWIYWDITENKWKELPGVPRKPTISFPLSVVGGADTTGLTVKLLVSGSPIYLDKLNCALESPPFPLKYVTYNIRLVAVSDTAREGQKIIYKLVSDKPVHYPIRLSIRFSGTAISQGLTVEGLSSTPRQDTWVATIPKDATEASFYATVLKNNLIGYETSLTATVLSSSDQCLKVTDMSKTVAVYDGDGLNGRSTLVLKKILDAAEPSTNGTYRIGFTDPDLKAESPLTIYFAVKGTATLNQDYVTLNGTVTLPKEANSVDVPITVMDDNIIEPQENVNMQLKSVSNPIPYVNFNVRSEDTVLLVKDDDSAPENLLINVTKEADAREGGNNGYFKIAIANNLAASVPVTVSYRLSGTARRGKDYLASSVPDSTIVIPAMVNSVSIPIEAISDKVIEETESVILQLKAGVGSGLLFLPGKRPVDTVLIADVDNTDNNRKLQIVAANASEPATNGSFTISLPSGFTTGFPIPFEYTVYGDAESGLDYNALSGTATIEADSGKVVIPVRVVDDQVIEQDESVSIKLKGSTVKGNAFAPVGDSTGTLIIKDNDNISTNRRLRIAKETNGAEPGTSATFRISLPPGVTSYVPVQVTYKASGTATEGADYEALTGEATIPAGQNSVVTTVYVKDDNILENTENIVIAIVSGRSIQESFLPDATASKDTLLIKDDDNTPARIRVGIEKVSDAIEGKKDGQFRVRFYPHLNVPGGWSVDYTSFGSLRNRGADVKAVKLVPEGDSVLNLYVEPWNDDVIRGTETYGINITALKIPGISSYSYENEGAIINIEDDDRNDTAKLLLNITRIKDAREPDENGLFQISLPTGVTAAFDVTVKYELAAYEPGKGMAQQGSDYKVVSGEVVIPAGQNAMRIAIEPLADGIIEEDEMVIAKLRGGTGSGLSFKPDKHSQDTLRIFDETNNDKNLKIRAEVVNHLAEPITDGAFRISYPNNIIAGGDMLVSYNISGTARPGIDYTALSGTTTIKAGESSVLVPVKVMDDNLLEGTEDIKITLTAATFGNRIFSTDSLSNVAIMKLIDNESDSANLLIDIQKVKNGVEGGTNGAFRISLKQGVVAAVSVNVNYTVSGNAVNGKDYTFLSGTAVIPAGENSVDVPVEVIDDNVIELEDSVILTLISGQANDLSFKPVQSRQSAFVLIADNDYNSSNNLLLRVSAIKHAAEPADTGVFMILLPPGVTSDFPVTVKYETSGVAQMATDYKQLSGSAVIPPGSNGVPINIEVIDDKIIEPIEEVILKVTSGVGAGIVVFQPGKDSVAMLMIKDNDHTPENLMLKFLDKENAAEPSKSGSFTIGIPNGMKTSGPVTITYQVSGTAKMGDDFSTLSGTARINAGDSAVTIKIAVLDDKIVEGNERVEIKMVRITSEMFNWRIDAADSTASIEILDDDNVPANLIVGVKTLTNAAEPSTPGEFSFFLPTGVTYGMPVKIKFSLGGKAIRDVDYNILADSIIIPSGSNSAKLMVNVLDDQIIENTETVTLQIDSAQAPGVTLKIDDNQHFAFLSIADNDTAVANRIVSIRTEQNAAEPGSMGRFQIYLPNHIRSGAQLTVGYDIVGSATDAVDFKHLPRVATIPAGENSVWIDVEVLDDNIVEGTEDVRIKLISITSDITNFLINKSSDVATVNIVDDDNAPKNLQVKILSTEDASEPSKHGNIRIGLPNGIVSSDTINITYQVEGTAKPNLDYKGLSGSAIIPAGVNSIVLPVEILDDKIIEGEETVIVKLTMVTSSQFKFSIADSVGTVKIIDNEHTLSNLVIGVFPEKNAAEPSVDGYFRIGFPSDISADDSVIVKYSISGSAGPDVDYVAPGNTIIIPAGSNRVYLPVKILDDKIIEGTEEVNIKLDTVILKGLSLRPDPNNRDAVLKVIDDDPTASNLMLSVSNIGDAAEPDRNGTFRISLPTNITSSFPVTISYEIRGTATLGTDYRTLSGNALIPAGKNSVDVVIEALDDKVIEGDETVELKLLSGSGGGLFFTVNDIKGSAKLLLKDDDNTQENLHVNILAFDHASEPTKMGSVFVGLPNGVSSADSITVTYQVSGTAIPGIDYKNLSGTVVIKSGENSAHIPIEVIDDKIIEGNESVKLKLTKVTAAHFNLDIQDSLAYVNIADDDNVSANLIVGVANVNNASEPSIDGKFSIFLPSGIAAAVPVKVTYRLNGSALSGKDYVTPPDSVVIPAGKNSVDLNIKVMDDTEIEGDEQVEIVLEKIEAEGFDFSKSVVNGNANLTIIDNDNNVSNKLLSIIKVADGGEPDSIAKYRIFLPGGITSSSPITVSYEVAGSALNGVDYQALSGTLVIPAGSNSVILEVKTIDDKIIEGSETVVVKLTSGNGGNGNISYGINVNSASATITILDDDNNKDNLHVRVLSYEDASEPTKKGNIVIGLPNGFSSAVPVTITYQIQGSALAGVDYKQLSGIVDIPAGINTVQLPVEIIDDKIIEGTETVILKLTKVTSSLFNFSVMPNDSLAEVQIYDDEHTYSNLKIGVSPVKDAAEPTLPGVFRLSFPGDVSAAVPVEIKYRLSGTASSDDYELQSTDATIPAGQNGVDVVIKVVDDKIIEGRETIVLSLVEVKAKDLALTLDENRLSATIGLIDNDSIYTNLVIGVKGLKNCAEPATDGAFKVSLPNGITSSTPVSVSYEVSGTATLDKDYVALGGTVIIPAGENSVVIPVKVIDDKIIENTDTIYLKLLSGAGGGIFYQVSKEEPIARITLEDDDMLPENLQVGVKFVESGAEPSKQGQVIIGLLNNVKSAVPITISYQVGGTATSGEDYVKLSGTAVIKPEENNVVIPVLVNDDKIIEGEETVEIKLAMVTSPQFNFAVGKSDSIAIVKIADDDANASNLRVGIWNVKDASEPIGQGKFKVGFPEGITAATAVDVKVNRRGTAIYNEDYQLLGNTITIPAGRNYVEVPIDVIDDTIIEGTEEVTFELESVANLAGLKIDPANNTATINIIDNDVTASNLVLNLHAVKDAAEIGENGEFRISLPVDVVSANPITVTYTIGGTATNGIDYKNLSGKVIIPAGQNSVNIKVLPENDNIIEGDETVVLTLVSGESGVLLYKVNDINKSATINIIDDDKKSNNLTVGVISSQDGAEPSRQGVIRIGFLNDVSTAVPVIVTYQVNGSAIPGQDYTALEGTVEIKAGESGADINVKILDDKIIEGNESVSIKLIDVTSSKFDLSIDPNKNTATINITDDDAIASNLLVGVESVKEGGEPFTAGTCRFFLPPGIKAIVPIKITFDVTGTAEEGVDYTTSGRSVVIPAGSNDAVVQWDVLDDNIMERTETIETHITQLEARGFDFRVDANKATAIINIIDDDNVAANRVLKVSTMFNAEEPSGRGVFRIQLPDNLTVFTPVSIAYTVKGSATPGADYKTLSGVTTIPVGKNEAMVHVIVEDDLLIEGDENVEITLKPATVEEFTFMPSANSGSANMIIKDNELVDKNLLVSLKRVSDGAEPSNNGSFAVSLPTGIKTSVPISISYEVDGTATNGTDYGKLTGSVTLPAGESMVQIPIIAIDDNIIEGDEIIKIKLLSATSPSVNKFKVDSSAAIDSITIFDNDNITSNKVVNVVSELNGAEPSKKGVFKIMLPSNVISAVPVQVSFRLGGSAQEGLDYDSLLHVVTITAGNNFVSLPISVLDDKIIEGNESVDIQLVEAKSDRINFSVDNKAASLVITDDDLEIANRSISVTKVNDAGEPSEIGKFRVSLSSGFTSSMPVTITARIGGTALDGEDYNSINNVFVLPALTNSVEIPVNVIDDQIIEEVEFVSMKLLKAETGELDFKIVYNKDSAAVAIQDNDNIAANKKVSIFKISDAAEPALNGDFMISLPPGVTSSLPVVVNYKVEGNATEDADFRRMSGVATIPAGRNSVNVTMEVLDDNIMELEESVQVTLKAAKAVSQLFNISDSANKVDITIADNDNSLSNQQIRLFRSIDGAEPNKNAAFQVGFAQSTVTSSLPVTVKYSLSGSATEGLDFQKLEKSVTIPAGKNKVEVQVTVMDDQIIERTENIVVKIASIDSSALRYLTDLSNDEITLNIEDNDNVPQNREIFVTGEKDAQEPDGNGSFRISLAEGTTAADPISITYNIGGTAIGGSDYERLNGIVVLEPGNNSVVIPVKIKEDNIIEGDETLSLSVIDGVSNSIKYVPSKLRGVDSIVIRDDIKPANFKISIKPVSNAFEPNKNGSFRIELPVNVTALEPVMISYEVSGTAQSYKDYKSLSGIATILPGHNNVMLPVIIEDDQVIESDETVVVTLVVGTTSSATFVPDSLYATATINVIDNDKVPRNLYVKASKVEDAAEPNTTGIFRVSLMDNISSSSPVVVKYVISGTATSGKDFVQLPDSIVIPAETNSVDVPVAILDDKIMEGNEAIHLKILSAANEITEFSLRKDMDSAVMVLKDDDYTPKNQKLETIVVNDAHEGGRNGLFRIAFPDGITSSMPVNIKFELSGTAKAGIDYQTMIQEATILAGMNSVDIPLAVVNDSILEGDEQVTLRLTIASMNGVNLLENTTDSTAMMTITDDDNTQENLNLRITKIVDCAEPQSRSDLAIPGEFKIAIPAGYTTAYPIDINLMIGGTALENSDYLTIDKKVRIPAGGNSVIVRVTPMFDHVIEADETVVAIINSIDAEHLTFTSNRNSKVDTVIIKDMDAVSANLVLGVKRLEDAAEPAVNGSFRVFLPDSITSSRPINVKYTVTGTASNGVDYANLSGVMVIPAGTNSYDLQVKVIDDDIIEGDEKVIFTIIGGQSGAFTFLPEIGHAVDSLKIADDDNNPENLQVALEKLKDASEPADTGMFKITLRKNKVLTIPLLIKYNIAGTAANGTDYNRLSGVATIQPGSSNVFIPVIVRGDSVIEDNESVKIKITSIEAGGFDFKPEVSKDTAELIILDSTVPEDLVISINKTKDAAEPSTNGQFVIGLPDGIRTDKELRINYTIAGNAKAGIDYKKPREEIIIPKGGSKITLPVEILDDYILEDDEKVVLTLNKVIDNPFIAHEFSLIKAIDSLTIYDDERIAADKTIIMERVTPDSVLNENGGKVKWKVGFRDPSLACDVDVFVETKIGGTAVNGMDYDSIEEKVRIPAGQSYVMVELKAKKDSLLENNETMTIKLLKATSSLKNIRFVSEGSDKIVLLDEFTNVRLKLKTLQQAAEPFRNGIVSIGFAENDYITLEKPARIKYQWEGTAISGKDYVPLTGEIILPAGKNSVQLQVEVMDDDILEGKEVIKLQVVSIEHALTDVKIEADVAGMVTIEDDDMGRTDARINVRRVLDASEKGDTGIFRIGFEGEWITADNDVMVYYNLLGTASEGYDYRPIQKRITIPAGENAVLVKVIAIDDKIIEPVETVFLNLIKVTIGTLSDSMQINTEPVPDNAVKIYDNDTARLTVRALRDSVNEGSKGVFAIRVDNDVKLSQRMPIKILVTHDKDRKYFLDGKEIVNGEVLALEMPGSEKLLQVVSSDNDVTDEDGFFSIKLLQHDQEDLNPYKFGGDATSRMIIKDNDEFVVSWKHGEDIDIMEGSTGQMTPLKLVITTNRKSSRDMIVSYSFPEVPGLPIINRAIPVKEARMPLLTDYDDGAVKGALNTLTLKAGEQSIEIKVLIMSDSIFEADEYFRANIEKCEMKLRNGNEVDQKVTNNYIRIGILNDDTFNCTEDYDKDGIPNWKEAGFTSLYDCDGRGLLNAESSADTDGDKLPDYLDDDSDNDGIPDSIEGWTRDLRAVDNNQGSVRVNSSVSPNGDGVGNDCLQIENIEQFPDNEITIFNRWGNVVYVAKGYNNRDIAFCGYSESGYGRKGNMVTDGVYFFMLKYKNRDQKIERRTGYIAVKR